MATTPKPNPPCPACPRCGTNRHATKMKTERTYICSKCKGMYDDDPDEGGTHSDRNPAARLEREDRRKQQQRRR